MRKIIVKNEKLITLVRFIKDIAKQGVELAEQGEKVEQEARRLEEEMRKLQHIRDKKEMVISKLVSKMDFIKDIGEFEKIGTISEKDGEIEIEVFDMVEEFKSRYRDKAKNAKTEVEKLTK